MRPKLSILHLCHRQHRLNLQYYLHHHQLPYRRLQIHQSRQPLYPHLIPPAVQGLLRCHHLHRLVQRCPLLHRQPPYQQHQTLRCHPAMLPQPSLVLHLFCCQLLHHLWSPLQCQVLLLFRSHRVLQLLCLLTHLRFNRRRPLPRPVCQPAKLKSLQSCLLHNQLLYRPPRCAHVHAP